MSLSLSLTPHGYHWCSPYWTADGGGWKSWKAPGGQKKSLAVISHLVNVLSYLVDVLSYLVDGGPGDASLSLHQVDPLLHGHLVRLEAERGGAELGLHPRLPLSTPPHLRCFHSEEFEQKAIPPTFPLLSPPSCHAGRLTDLPPFPFPVTISFNLLWSRGRV